MLFVCFTVFYSVFARYDAAVSDGDGGSYSDSGRTCYVTDSLTDAFSLWDRWNDTSWWTDDEYFSVRRGGVTPYLTLSDVCQAPEVHHSDECDFGFDPEELPAWFDLQCYTPYGPLPVGHWGSRRR